VGRFDVQSTLGGMMPTGKIAAQGGKLPEYNGASAGGERLWADLEDNATYNIGARETEGESRKTS